MATHKKYLKSDPITHILIRPDMYVGSKAFKKSNELIWNGKRLIKKEIDVSPALLRLFIEILSNAVDNSQRDGGKKMTTIKVNVGPKECSVWNDGDVIPITMNNEEKIFNHTLIFGHLLAGSNYDDTEQRLTSGRNGLGAKLTNVFSDHFEVEGLDPDTGLKLTQTWTDHMRKTEDPKVVKTKSKKGYTKVSWKTDYSQFGVKELSKDMMDLYGRFVIDAAMITGLTVYLNDEKVFATKANRMVKYAELLDPDNKEIMKLGDSTSTVLVMSNGEYEQLAFVNGVYTRNGGKHVDTWVDAVCRPLLKKLKGNLTLKDVKPYFRFIVVTNAPNPVFDSQEKHTLTSPSITSTPITVTNVNKIMKWSVGETLKSLNDTKEKTKAIKTAKKTKISVDGYDRANNAGGRHSKDCTLIVCEGLSAKTFTVAGIEQGLFGKKGRDWFGIYPLRGKLLNVRNASPTSIAGNAVIANLMKILGLEYGHPDKLSNMNYGKMCIITDADVDGIHIEGLLLNFFDTLFPKLLEKDFVISMKTPIMKTVSPKGLETYYFDERTYAEALPRLVKGTTTKYFKGLGTNKPKDVKQVFGIKMLQYSRDTNSNNAFETAFDKTKSEERRQWISSYTPDAPANTLDDLKNQVNDYSTTTFLTDELVKFSYEDCQRSLPSVIDGLKESQRKILYAAKKRKLHTEMKVAQFGGYVAEHTNYHHGEQNLFDTIIKMAQDFTGSNNVPLLSQDGMFGTRLSGGKDAASARYIFTKMTEECKSIFPDVDDELLTRRIDDGDVVEPHHYIPTVPMLLVNGCVGIGTGWSTNVPSYSMVDVKENAIRWIKKQPLKEMTPGFNEFKGDIEKVGKGKYVTRGKMEVKGKTIVITELPVGLWNDKFKLWCESNKEILNLKDNSTTDTVHYELTITPDFNIKKLEKELETSISVDNMVVFDQNGTICKVSIQDIYDMWGDARKTLYEKRKTNQLKTLSEKIDKTKQRIDFIKMVQSGKLNLTDSEEKLLKIMKGKKITDESLLNIPVRSLTEEKRKDQEEKLRVLMMEEKTLKTTSIETMWLSELN
jgi:DNA topoisomerase-2